MVYLLLNIYTLNLKHQIRGLTKYGGKHRVTVIHGDGVGPEMMFHVKEAFTAVRVNVDYEDILLNSKTISDTLIDQAVMAVRRNGVALKGNIDTDIRMPNTSSANVALRYI